MTLEEQIEAAKAEQAKVSGGGLAASIEARRKTMSEKGKHDNWDKANDFREGLWSSVVDTGYGLNELVTGDLRPDQRAYAEDLRARSQESGWGTGGRVVGEVGMLMAPGGALGATAKGLSRVHRSAKALKAAAAATKGLKYDVAASAALGGAQLPSDPNTSRMENALYGGGGALAGAGLAKTLGVLGKGVNRSEAGQRMIDKGVRLTPGRLAESPVLGGVENLMRRTPGTSQAVNTFQERAFKDWNLQMFNEVAPKGNRITKVGQDGFDQLQSAFNRSYDAAWRMAGKPSNEGLVSIVNQATKGGEELSGSAGHVMTKVLADVNNLSKNYTPQGLQSLDKTLRAMQENAFGGANPEKYLGDAIKNIRDTLRNSVGDVAQDALAEVDARWSPYLPLKIAGESVQAVKTKGVLDTDMVSNAIGGQGGTGGGRQLTGSAPYQQSLNDALDTIGEKDPNMILNIMKATAQAAPSPHGAMDVAGRVITGQTGAQKAIRPALESQTAKALIESLLIPTAAKVGGAYYNE